MAPQQLQDISASAPPHADEGNLDSKERHGDKALEFLRAEEVGDEIEFVNEKQLVRKIDWMVMPLMWCCYMLEFLDKSLCKQRSPHST